MTTAEQIKVIDDRIATYRQVLESFTSCTSDNPELVQTIENALRLAFNERAYWQRMQDAAIRAAQTTLPP